MTALHQWLTFGGLTLVIVALVLDMTSLGIDVSGTPPQAHVRGRHFGINILMIAGVLMFCLGFQPFRTLQDWVDGKTTTESSSLSKAPIPDPDPADFDLNLPNGKIEVKKVPPGYVAVIFYDSVAEPLTPEQQANGRVLGGNGTYSLPVDATNVRVNYWDKGNLVTGTVGL